MMTGWLSKSESARERSAPDRTAVTLADVTWSAWESHVVRTSRFRADVAFTRRMKSQGELRCASGTGPAAVPFARELHEVPARDLERRDLAGAALFALREKVLQERVADHVRRNERVDLVEEGRRREVVAALESVPRDARLDHVLELRERAERALEEARERRARQRDARRERLAVVAVVRRGLVPSGESDFPYVVSRTPAVPSSDSHGKSESGTFTFGKRSKRSYVPDGRPAPAVRPQDAPLRRRLHEDRLTEERRRAQAGLDRRQALAHDGARAVAEGLLAREPEVDA